MEEQVENTEVIENTNEVVNVDYSEKLDTIHEDLGIIACFLVFFTIVIILKYSYKFFNMIFQF